MKVGITRLWLLAVITLVSTVSMAAESGRPNIVFILADDLGWRDLGCYGSTFHETPRIDAFAQEAMRFDNAYAASCVCSPTRASILTGKYPARINFTRATPTHNLPHEEVTLAETFQEAGYRTAHIGKWHMTLYGEKAKGFEPETHGYDVNIAGHSAGTPGSYFYPYKNKGKPKNNVPDLEDGKPDDYLTDALTCKAIDFMKESGDQPFFVSLWYHTVHTPVTGKKDKIEKYKAKLQELGLSGDGAALAEYDNWNRTRQDHAEYAAMVESLDENVGRLLDYLEASEKDQNTIVIFFSDNGGLSVGKSKKGGPASNTPLRAGKAWMYEGGIREPLIVKIPGVTQGGTLSKAMVISTDFYPTLLEAAGLPLQPDQHLDGLSLMPLLSGAQEMLDRDTLYFHFPHDHGVNSMGASGAIRVGDYKLVERFSNGAVELFNLANDLGEQNDLSREKPERTAKLKTLLHNWRKEVGAMMPKKKATP